MTHPTGLIVHWYRSKRYLKNVIGVLKYGCYWPRTAEFEWVNQARKPHAGKWRDRPWHAKHKTWYIGFHERQRAPLIIKETSEEVVECGEYFIPFMAEPRRNALSDFLNKYTDKFYSIQRLRY